LVLALFFALTIIPQLAELYLSAERGSFLGTKLKKSLDLAELFVSLFGISACLLIPQRPAVFYDGSPVDGLRSVTAWSRYTYAWALPLLALSKTGRRQEFEDLALLSVQQRAGYLYEVFIAASYPGHLIMQLIRYHAWAFTVQWLLTIADGIFSLGPQLAMFQLLKILEARDAGVPVGDIATFWVIALGVTQVLGGFFMNRMW
jgi:hypothetical protein